MTITKIESFTLDLDGRKRVKLVVAVALTPEGKKRVDQELN